MGHSSRPTAIALAPFLVVQLVTAPVLAAAPAAVSPGEAARFASAPGACPTFSFATTAAALGHELVVYAVDATSGVLQESPSLSARFPNGASSWTPSAERCLRPGRYAWAVRARVEGEEPAPWSNALLFEVSARPSESELEQALDVVRRYLGSRGELVGDEQPRSGGGGRTVVRRDPADDRGVVSRTEPGDVPERVTSAAGSEPTIVLGGTPVARLAASDFARDSASAVSFDFHNPGAGDMTLTVDGDPVVTTTTDQDTTYLPGNQLELTGTTFGVVEGSGSDLDADKLDGVDSAGFVTVSSDPYVDETGDTMNGLLILDPASGFALQTGTGDAIDLGSGANLFQGGVSLLRTAASANLGVGLGALDEVTSGAHNTALGRDALGADTTGTGNTAVGTYTLDSNTTGTYNTAVGSSALGLNVTGSANTAVGRAALLANTASSNTALGAYALDANTNGSFNTAVGRDALGANTSASFNTAVGRSALLVSTGTSNTAVGANALDSNTAGYDNTAVGRDALSTNTTTSSNTAVGRNALLANTASSNTALGAFALDANTTGSANTAVGTEALGANTTATNNTAVGRSALTVNTASSNTALGAFALDSNTTGASNTALGTDALGANTTASDNTAVGRSALLVNSSGSGNTALGANALDANTTGIGNTAAGRLALGANTTSSYNTAVGDQALGSNTTGLANTAVGRQALVLNTTSSDNTAVGYSALFANTGTQNIAVGGFALDSNTSGGSNTSVGFGALSSNTTGDNNIALGAGAGGLLTTGDNNIDIGNSGAAGEGGKIRIGVDGTQTETFIAGIEGNTTTGGIAVFVNSSGELGTATSSRRFKEEVADVGALSELLLALRPVSFRYKPEVLGSGERAERPLEFGLIAEEVAEVFPELVVFDENGAPYTVRYHLLVPLLLAELQSEHEENALQRTEIEELRRLVARGASAVQSPGG